MASSSQHIPEVGIGLSNKPRLQPERECAGDQQFERDSKQTVIELVDKTEGGSGSIKGYGAFVVFGFRTLAFLLHSASTASFSIPQPRS